MKSRDYRFRLSVAETSFRDYGFSAFPQSESGETLSRRAEPAGAPPQNEERDVLRESESKVCWELKEFCWRPGGGCRNPDSIPHGAELIPNPGRVAGSIPGPKEP
jgi:hypothetical protein